MACNKCCQANCALQIGSTIFHTLAGVLLLLLVSPIYDGARIYYSTKDKSEQVALDLRQAKTAGVWILAGFWVSGQTHPLARCIVAAVC